MLSDYEENLSHKDDEKENIDREKRYKLLLLLALFTLLLILLFQLYAEDAKPLQKVRPLPQSTVSSKPLGRQVVLGGDEAKTKKDLRNPFSRAHELESEKNTASNSLLPKPKGEAVALTKKAPSGRPKGASLPPQTTSKNMTTSVKTPTLQGIAKSPKEDLAIISIDGTPHVLSLGNSVGEWVLVDIGAQDASLYGNGRILHLSLGNP